MKASSLCQTDYDAGAKIVGYSIDTCQFGISICHSNRVWCQIGDGGTSPGLSLLDAALRSSHWHLYYKDPQAGVNIAKVLQPYDHFSSA